MRTLVVHDIDMLVQERPISIVNALEIDVFLALTFQYFYFGSMRHVNMDLDYWSARYVI